MCLCKPEIRTPWCDDCQTFAYKRIKELEKINSRLRASINRLYSCVSNGEHLTGEWIKEALLAAPSGIAVDALVKMRSADAIKIKELGSTIVDLQSELARKKYSLSVACNRVEELEDKLKIAGQKLWIDREVGGVWANLSEADFGTELDGKLKIAVDCLQRTIDEDWSQDISDTLEQLGELK